MQENFGNYHYVKEDRRSQSRLEKMSGQQFCLRWNNHQPNFISVCSSLLHNGALVDVTLAAEGKQLQAHKIVLSACSSYFQVRSHSTCYQISHCLQSSSTRMWFFFVLWWCSKTRTMSIAHWLLLFVDFLPFDSWLLAPLGRSPLYCLPVWFHFEVEDFVNYND